MDPYSAVDWGVWYTGFVSRNGVAGLFGPAAVSEHLPDIDSLGSEAVFPGECRGLIVGHEVHQIVPRMVMRLFPMKAGLRVCWVCLPTSLQGEERADAAIFAKDAKLELLFTRRARINSGLAEGPAVAPDGSIYFTTCRSARRTTA